MQLLSILFAAIQLITSEPTRGLSSMNSLLQMTKLQLLHINTNALGIKNAATEQYSRCGTFLVIVDKSRKSQYSVKPRNGRSRRKSL